MGHIAAKTEYLNLQRRLDRMPVGAPAHRALFEMLEHLFTPAESRIAAVMPLRLTTAREVARLAGEDLGTVQTVLDRLCNKGLVADLPRDGKPTSYFLNPTIVGFIEYSMMRVDPDVDHSKLAGLIWEYLREDPQKAFLSQLVGGDTFIARPLVNEQVLDPDMFTEVLDWEKASHVIDDASSFAEGVCHCRHVKLHQGERCDYPLEHCLSLGMGADYLVRNGLAKPIDRSRAHEILAYAREHGCVQMADNVRDRPLYICNCCKCCCEMMEAFRTFPNAAKVVTSNYVAAAQSEECTGCGKCATACPIDAIRLVPAEPTDKVPKRKARAEIDTELCLGCGVCHTACAYDGIQLEPVGQRTIAPSSVMHRLMLQAIERGKLANLLFSDPTRLSHRTLAAFFSALLALPPAKQLLANRQLKSRFVEGLLTRR